MKALNSPSAEGNTPRDWAPPPDAHEGADELPAPVQGAPPQSLGTILVDNHINTYRGTFDHRRLHGYGD